MRNLVACSIVLLACGSARAGGPGYRPAGDARGGFGTSSPLTLSLIPGRKDEDDAPAPGDAKPAPGAPAGTAAGNVPLPPPAEPLPPPSDEDIPETLDLRPPELKPYGYTGGRVASTPPSSGGAGGARSGSADFLPIPDRWRIGFPGDYRQNTRARFGGLNPYLQNVLKGDYPIPGTQDKFFMLTATSDTLFEARRLPVGSNVSSVRPGSFDFFGAGRQFFINQNFILSFSLFKGDVSYRPRDFEIRFTPVININYLKVAEQGIVKPNFENGTTRADGFVGVQELFYEQRLATVSNNFDILSVRAGIQPFVSDFRGFLFSDNEPGIRLFGNLGSNRTQYNLAWFTQVEKDTNSGLNTLDLRGQNVFIANVFQQDFIWPGYTAQLSFHANIDDSDAQINKNGFIVRPSTIGDTREKSVNAYYLGWAGDGHIGKLNITHQFYQALGHESFNEIAGRRVNINGQFFALELSIDKDYTRYRASFAYSSPDRNPTDRTAHGFDSIFDNPNFAGGGSNFFTRQQIPLSETGVNLTQRNSFIPDLRTAKELGQANFVNPGLFLYNVGVDIDLTPKTKLITNVSYLQFADTSSLNLVLHDNKISRDIGIDYSAEIQYRPFLNNNAIINFGASALTPGRGFKDIYTSQTLYSTFLGLTFTY